MGRDQRTGLGRRFGSDVLVIKMDRRTRRLSIKAPDDLDLALRMLHGTFLAVKEAKAVRDRLLPKIAIATPGEIKALRLDD
jgi:hypothetical protein